LSGFDIDVVAIRMVGRQGQTYFAELDLRGRTGRNVHSCRPTDALAIALRQAVPVPILIDSRLFEESGDVVPWTPPGPEVGGTADVPAQGETAETAPVGTEAGAGEAEAPVGEHVEAPVGEHAEAETDDAVVIKAADRRSGTEGTEGAGGAGGRGPDKAWFAGNGPASESDTESDTEVHAPIGVRGDTEEIVRP
jgi:hypothetical protein